MSSFKVDPPAYWFPKHFVFSAWVEHAPFAYWLVSALRPRSIVELGTHNGYSFFVLAEAVRRLGLDCTVEAVDSWEGDDHAGFYGEEVYASVVAVVEADYADFTRLHRAYFSEAVSQFADKSIDLLHIDGRHGYDDVKEDFETYVPKLSDRAVVIFHDTNEFHEGFEVHRFWDELAVTKPSFNFHHGHGLGVLAFGDDVPEAILQFLSQANEQASTARETYHALGADVAQSVSDRLERERLAGMDELLRAAQDELRLQRETVSWRITAPLRKVRSLLRK